ncbi:Ppx/GppA family phosphatase [Actinomycetaceae bacterium TAE3-ERU4]|nr:Ppx/GppA family phosphatase [Actinomycetaceae bacterium TAE3-ERU4]
MTTRVAGIDCGTNSIRLLIADRYEDGHLEDIVREMRIVRLGEDVDKTGRLASQALERTFAALDEYAHLIRSHGVEKVMFVATSASRDAENSAEFVAGVESRLGIKPEVIAGTREAELSFRGATSALKPSSLKPVLVVDIGGGSTEFALGTDDLSASISVDMGCVRLTERFLKEGKREDAELFIDELLDRADEVVNFSQVATLVGLAGSVTTITAHALGLDEYDPERINGASLTLEQVDNSCAALFYASASEKEKMSFMHPGRRDVIAAGALIWSKIINRVDSEVARAGGRLGEIITSEHDILDGIALAAK